MIPVKVQEAVIRLKFRIRDTDQVGHAALKTLHEHLLTLDARIERAATEESS